MKQLSVSESLVWVDDSQGLTACWFSATRSLSGVYSMAQDSSAIKIAFTKQNGSNKLIQLHIDLSPNLSPV